VIPQQRPATTQRVKTPEVWFEDRAKDVLDSDTYERLCEIRIKVREEEATKDKRHIIKANIAAIAELEKKNHLRF
jgi:hypothetical protein